MWKLPLLLLSIYSIGVFAAEDATYQNTPKAQQPPPTTKAPTYQAPPQQQSQPGVKNDTAYGRYDSGGRGQDSREYDHKYHHGHRIFRGFDVPLVDDYICDLDATILIVTNSDHPNAFMQAADAQGPPAPSADAAPGNTNYGRAKRSAYLPPDYAPGRDSYGPPREYPPREYYDGRERYDRRDRYGRDREYDHDFDHYGHGPGVVANADRLRCSVIASNDEDSCTTCCKLSARRDRSISKDKIIGFLVDNNQVSYEAQSPAGEGYGGDMYGDRKKRSDYGQDQPQTQGADASAAPADTASADTPDMRCVCCAPKRYRPFIFDRFARRPSRYHYHRGPY